MNQLLAICDRETILVKTLSAYLKDRFHFPIMAFDDADRFLAFEKEREEEDICLIGEDFLDAFQTEQLLTKVRRPLYLTEAKNGSGIYKYQSIHEMAKAILKLCEEEALLPVKGTAATETKLIAFYSPAHHMLQSSIALTMGQILAKNKKVLYLNFEPYSGFEYIMQKKFVYDMMDILYFLQEDAEKFRCRLESMVEMTGNLYYLPPVFSYPDMEEIDEKTWQAFLRKIIRETDYEVIILDLTEQVRGLFSLLELCDEIYSCKLLDVIQQIVAKANRVVNESSPIVDARLFGSRVHVVLPPVALNGPILTIRRFGKTPLLIPELLRLGSVSQEICTFLEKLVIAGYNIFISGGTGSGKTTFLNALSSFIPRTERIITIEDSAELQIQGNDNLVRLETRNANVEGCKPVTIRDLIRASLRMRPDRIIVGEVRGAEAIDMLQAFICTI